MARVLGHHLLAEFWGCAALDGVERAKSVLRHAVEASGARLIELSAHPFSPQGLSAVAVISESHVAIHTWPEYSYAAVDVFTCGNTDSEAIVRTLADAWQPRRIEQRSLDRGVLRSGPGGDEAPDSAEQPGEPFGWEVALDLQDCDLASISEEASIRGFVEQLCDEVLEMRRFGEPLVERFGAADPKTAGYSAVQLIETSSVVAHFSEENRSAYIDIFSCRAFDADQVEAFARKTFGAQRARSHVWIRE